MNDHNKISLPVPSVLDCPSSSDAHSVSKMKYIRKIIMTPLPLPSFAGGRPLLAAPFPFDILNAGIVNTIVSSVDEKINMYNRC